MGWPAAPLLMSQIEWQWPPQYAEIYQFRHRELISFGADPQRLAKAKAYYREEPAAFISTWGDTYDPRHAGQSPWVPFVLFPKQIALVDFMHRLVKAEASGLVEKSRDMGATWLGCYFSVWLWLFWPGASIGWGSRKQELVDRIGDPDSIFEKMRMAIRRLPFDFRPEGFDPEDHLNYMKIVNPENGSSITGETGDNIGRGGRKLVYLKDESAHYEHPEAIEAALTDNTNVQIDISSVFGTGTVFERKRNAGLDWAPGQEVIKGRTNVFVFDWRDHPEKTEEWYRQRRQKAEDEGLLHIFAQEVDRDYAAALEGVIIPAPWVRSAIDAHKRLGIDDSGGYCAGLDVADEGGDTNALAIRKGIVLKRCLEWGKHDTGETTRRAIEECRTLNEPIDVQYDCVGIGAGVKGEVNRLRKFEADIWPRHMRFVPWNAGDEVLHKERHFIPSDKNTPLNGDLFGNLKAQAWWSVRRRFELTHRAVRSKAADATADERKFTWREDDLISLDSSIPNLFKLVKELSQATITYNSRLKMIIDKKPEGAKSPNNADAVVMAFFPAKTTMRVDPELLLAASLPKGTRGTRRVLTRRPRLA